MTARRIFVHGSFAGFPVFDSSVKEPLEIGHCLANDLSEVLYVNSTVRVFLDLEGLVLLAWLGWFLTGIFSELRK